MPETIVFQDLTDAFLIVRTEIEVAGYSPTYIAVFYDYEKQPIGYIASVGGSKSIYRVGKDPIQESTDDEVPIDFLGKRFKHLGAMGWVEVFLDSERRETIN